MKERPILFSGPMVRALLEGRKTQTRREAKLTSGGHVRGIGTHKRWHPADPDAFKASPYGQPGDRLWVRETFAPNLVLPLSDREPGDFIYRADLQNGVTKYSAQWKPSIFCTRKASRITLEIVGVRVERLNDITKADAVAEGIERIAVPPHDAWKNYLFETAHPRRGVEISDKRHRLLGYESPCASYTSLWESINGAGSWAANPWVWVISFQRVA